MFRREWHLDKPSRHRTLPTTSSPRHTASLLHDDGTRRTARPAQPIYRRHTWPSTSLATQRNPDIMVTPFYVVHHPRSSVLSSLYSVFCSMSSGVTMLYYLVLGTNVQYLVLCIWTFHFVAKQKSEIAILKSCGYHLFPVVDICYAVTTH